MKTLSNYQNAGPAAALREHTPDIAAFAIIRDVLQSQLYFLALALALDFAEMLLTPKT